MHNTATDCIIGWAPSGRIYVASATFVPVQVPPPGGFFGILFPFGGVTVTSTSDEGRSFTAPVEPISSEDLPGLFARGLTPSNSGFANPYDRPWLRVDLSSGDVYIAASGHPQYYVTVSHDEGQTWSRLEALDCDETTPPSAHEVCGAYPAITGAHWQRHVVASGLPAASSVQVAANARDRNKFAVSIVPSSRAALLVYATRNFGASWSNPVSLGDLAVPHRLNRPWIAYSPQGRLGVFWRTAYPPFQPSALQSGTQDVFVALSKNDGRTFASPVKINVAPSPPPDPSQIVQDDTSFVALSEHAIYAAWGDWRPTVGNPRAI